MKLSILTPLLILIPVTSFAKWQVTGTPDANNDGNGDPQAGNYVFNIIPKDGNLTNSGMLGASSAQGEWWVANDSTAPWKDFIASPNTDVQPSYHITEDLHAGDTFYVGLSFENQIKDYTSEFRMANDLFGAGAQIYFGLRNITKPSVLQAWSQAEYDALVADGKNLPVVDGVQQVVGDPKYVGENGHIDNVEGLLYQGHSVGNATSAHVPDTNEFDTSQFEWVHVETDDTDADIVFSIKKDKNADSSVDSLELTEWVAYFVLPDDMTTIPGASWGDGAPPSDVDGEQDVVFSWTVDGKDGYSLVQETDVLGIPIFDVDGNPVFTDTPLANPTFNDATSGVFALIPEPSTMLLLFSGAGMLLTRRNRKAA